MNPVRSFSNRIKSRPPMSDRTAVTVLLVGTAGLLVTMAALNGGVAPAASTWDGIRTYLNSLLGSSFVMVLAFMALVVCVWQIAQETAAGLDRQK